MKTRRKSARKAAEAEADHEAGSSQLAEDSQPPSPSQPLLPSSNAIHLSIPPEVSLEDLSALIPETALNSPTPETIIRVYKLVLAQAAELSGATTELEASRAFLVRKDVELDQAFQDKEVAVSELESSINSVRKEFQVVLHERDELRASQVALQSQLSTISDSQSTRSSEIDALQKSVEDTGREKRDLVLVVDRLRSEGAQAEDEIKSLRESLKATRSELSDVQSGLRDVTSTQTTNRFRIESLEKQLQLATQERDRNSSELDAKMEEFAKYRREKQAQYVSLQSAFDTLNSEHEACKVELENFKRTHQAQQQQLTTAIEKVNTLQDQLAEDSAASRAHADTQARLIDLLEKRNAEAKKRVEEVDNEWDRMMQEHSDREERLKEQLRREKERADRLDANLARVLEGPDNSAIVPSGSAPELSSGANIVASFMKGTKLSDIFDENRRVKEEMQRVKMENVRLTDTTTQLISKVQEMAPQLAEQRVEYDRQKAEAFQLSHQLSVILAERDSNLQHARDTEHKFETIKKENSLLNSQLSDLGRQVQVLLRENSIFRDQGLADVEQDDGPPESSEGIDALISNQLVVFKHLPAFQEQYTKHLGVIRELGDKLERLTREQFDEETRLESQALEEASVAVATLQEEIENQKRAYDIKVRGLIQERDTYKARLSSQSQIRPTIGAGPNGHVEQVPGGSEYEALLADLQRNFDIYRTETGVDMSKLRDELQDAQKEMSQLHAALAKANAKVEFHNERYAMLNESYARQQTEISNLRRRNEDLLNQAHRVETASHQISEQLAATNSVVDRLRHETATLNAEKQLWKSVETRLSEENQYLNKEKAQLSDVISGINKMHHDLERSVDNDRRRLEAQVQLLESQSRDLKDQVIKERELVRHVTAQKDVETKELHVRLDQTARDLATTRETLVAAETSQDHLKLRADDLSRQLDAVLEKLSVYERRPGAASHGVDQSLDGRSREEQLEAEVAELKATLKMTEVDLNSAREHVEQFKNVARASEEAFEKVNEASSDYRRSAEEQLSQKEVALKSLQEKLHAAESEMSKLSGKLAELQQSLDSERQTFVNDKKTLEETIVDMTNSAANLRVDEAERASIIKIQKDRATAAEERYQREIISHAESIKTVEELKHQLSNIQTELREKQAAAETAQSMLTTSEASWKTQREVLDKELAEVNSRCHDLSSQNAILHQHLESVSNQAARIRHAADRPANESQDDVDDATSQLRSVVAYLRREKEIVDLQLELNKQENLRLKAQVENLTRSLEEYRKTLAEERERAAESVTSATQYNELLERINQLNLLRESNATLRNECEAHRKRAEGIEVRLRQVTAEVEPVKEEVHTVRAELESRDQQLERLERESQQWKERSQQILSKYDRIDPAEMQQLKDKLEKLEIEKTEWTQEKTTLQSQVTQTERYKENLVNFRKQYAALSKDSKEKLMAFEAEKKELQSERDSLKTQLLASAEASNQTAELSARIDKLTSEKTQLESTLSQERTRLEGIIQSERAKIAASAGNSVAADADEIAVKLQAAVEEAKRGWEVEKAELTKAREEATERESNAKAENKKLTEDKAHLEASTKKFQQRLAEQMKRQREQQATPTPDVEELVRSRVAEFTAKQMREQDAAVQSAVAAATEKLRQELQSASQADQSGGSSGELKFTTEKHEEELKALETRLTEKHAEELKVAVQSALESVSKQDVSPEVARDVESTVKERVDAALKEQEQRLLSTHAQELKQATENGRKEVSAKLSLKEQQLVKVVASRKELEEKVKELEARVGGSQSSAQKPSQHPAPDAAKTPTGGGLPRKPSITTALTASPSPTQAVRGAARGRGRGVAIRGGAAALATAHAAGRGGSVLANVNSATATSPTGTSILGAATASAAGKRTREETESSPESSLAKRLRSTPVTLQRNRHLPPENNT